MADDRKVSVPLLALGIVLVVGGILVGSAFLATRSGKEIDANERAAIVALRQIAAAEKAFRDEDLDDNGDRDYWTADLAGLAAMKIDREGKSLPLLPLVLAMSDLRPLGKRTKSPIPIRGYHYAAIRAEPPEEGEPLTHPSTFAFCACPAEYGKTGRKTYVIDQRGTVHAYDSQGQPPLAWPSQAEPVTRIVDE
ncbi:MAG TPA: DUF2950 family protein [Planctomycetota bacterium]